MGLDAYFSRITKVTDEQIKVAKKRLAHKQIGATTITPINDIDVIQHIKNYTTPICLITEEFDDEKWHADNNIPKDAVLFIIRNQAIDPIDHAYSYTYRFPDETVHEFKITDYEYTQYEIIQHRMYYIYNKYELSSMRNKWEIQNLIRDYYKDTTRNTDNCVYFPINEELLEQIQQLNKKNNLQIENIQDLIIPDDGILCYYGWY